ncbi:Uncharacterised protein [Vibrio cholerae]|nr:Uncharacterised protein [Vibrio cholerae]
MPQPPLPKPRQCAPDLPRGKLPKACIWFLC